MTHVISAVVSAVRRPFQKGMKVPETIINPAEPTIIKLIQIIRLHQIGVLGPTFCVIDTSETSNYIVGVRTIHGRPKYKEYDLWTREGQESFKQDCATRIIGSGMNTYLAEHMFRLISEILRT